MWVTASFQNDDGSPATGLSAPIISIHVVDDLSLPVDDQPMVEMAGGFYKYDFTLYDSSKTYAILCDGGSELSGANRFSIGVHGEGNVIVSWFIDDGSPAVDLSPTVDVYDVSDNSKIVDGEAMTQVGLGFYKYNFTDFNEDKDYLVIADGGVSVEGWGRYSIGFDALESVNVVSEGVKVTPVLQDGKIGVETRIMSGGDLVADFVLKSGDSPFDVMVRSIVVKRNVSVNKERINVEVGVI